MRIWPYLVVLGSLAGCAGTNPLDVADEQAAWLQSRLEEQGEDRISLIYLRLDGTSLKPGFLKAPVDAMFKAPSGDHELLLRIVRTQGMLTPPGRRRLEETCIPVHALLEPGRTYLPMATIEGDWVTVWIEAQDTRETVSDVVARQYYTVGRGEMDLSHCGGTVARPPRVGPPVIKRLREETPR